MGLASLFSFPTCEKRLEALLAQHNDDTTKNLIFIFTIELLFKMNSISRTTSLWSFPPALRPLIAARLYATQTGLGTSSTTPRPKRKAVTAFNDDGRVAWGDLSGREKAARTTQQTFNFGMILLGTVLTVCLGTILWMDNC